MVSLFGNQDDMLAARANRRAFLKMSLVLGASIPVAGSLLAACGEEDDATDDTPPAVDADDEDAADDVAEPADDDTADDVDDDSVAEPGEPVYGGTFILMGTREVDSLSPDNMGIVGQGQVTRNIHNPLVFLDPYFELQPTLAESYDVSDDGLEYTFKIREDVIFHDGEPMNAEDARYTYEYYGNPDNATVTGSWLQGIEEIDLPDDYTMHVRLATPNAPFLNQAGTILIVPEHYHSEIGEDAYKTSPIGTGPFKLREWRPAEFTELEVFEEHFKGRAYLDGIRYDVVPEASVANVNLRTGAADAFLGELVAEDKLTFAEDPQYSDYTVRVTTEFRLNHFVLNNRSEKFADLAVRQAMMHALDRDSIINDIYLGLGEKAHSSASPANEFYFEPDVRQYEFDPELAASILDEAGWEPGADGVREKDGVRLSWTCTLLAGDQVTHEVGLIAQQNFAEIGLEMELAEAAIAVILPELRDGDLEMSLFGNTYTGSDPDSRITLQSGAGGNFASYENEEVDELLSQGVQLVDPEERREIYSRIQQIVAEDIPFLFIMFPHRYDVFSPRIKGVPEDPQGAFAMYAQATNLWIDEG